MENFFKFSENQISFTCHIKIGGFDFQDEPEYELVQFLGYFRKSLDISIFKIVHHLKILNKIHDSTFFFLISGSDVDVDSDTDNLFSNDRPDGETDNAKHVFYYLRNDIIVSTNIIWTFSKISV